MERKMQRIAPPFNLDELAQKDDLPLTAQLPPELAVQLATQQVYITDKEGTSTAHSQVDVREEVQNAWRLMLPASSTFGLPGRTSGRIDRPAGVALAEDATPPFRPRWAAQVYQPRRAGPYLYQFPIRRRNGTTVEPYYGVFGPADRQVYWPATYPWGCIGRIFTWTNFGQPGWTWWGSGVLVGPRHVLTAGHVAPWTSSNWAMFFVPGYWDGASVFGAGATAWVSDYRAWNTNHQVAAHDLCVLRLYDPLGAALGWMGTKPYQRSWQGGSYWTLAGYPGTIAGASRPSAQTGIPVLDDDADNGALEIEYQGDASAGDSGGPLFGFWDDGPYAVGTVSGGAFISGANGEDNTINAGGNAMVDLVRWALTNWS